ncbi:MAG: hypothetical protein LBF41_10530 [Deltaproteobacteria bacterium]|jgi:diacylglycerol kinase family enzyme|nr:hypothetical protein [Deltaproteobacteria bacterium]
MEPVKNHLFIVNPVSFFKKADMDNFVGLVRERFEGMKAEVGVHVSGYPRDAIAHIRNYMDGVPADRKVRVYAVGGDGILFDCLNGIIGLPNAELGVMPYGRSNDFVRAFGEGINEHFRDLDNQLSGRSIDSDVISLGNSYALNTCTVGMESYAVYRAGDLQKEFKPVLECCPRAVSSFLYSLLFYVGGIVSANNKTLLNQHYRLSIDGTEHSGNYACINIANGPCYGGDKHGAIAAMPNDGLLDIVLFKSAGVFTFLSKGFDYLYGKFHKYPDLFSYHRAKEIIIRSDLPLVMQLDGEVFTDTSVTARITPNFVKIIAVKDFEFKRRAVLEDIWPGNKV